MMTGFESARQNINEPANEMPSDVILFQVNLCSIFSFYWRIVEKYQFGHKNGINHGNSVSLASRMIDDKANDMRQSNWKKG